jgi:hypothetical protein
MTPLAGLLLEAMSSRRTHVILNGKARRQLVSAVVVFLWKVTSRFGGCKPKFSGAMKAASVARMD